MLYRLARFAISDHTHALGYTAGDRWNGWERPRFPASTIRRLLTDAGAAWTETASARGPIFTYRMEGNYEKAVASPEDLGIGIPLYELDGWIWDLDETTDANTED